MAQILYLTQVLPYPLNSGAKIRAYYVLQQLAQRHDVTLVSFVREDDGPEAIRHLEGICDAIHTAPMRRSRLRDLKAMMEAGLTGRSVIILRDRIGDMYDLLSNLVRSRDFDVIHADQTSMAQYALYAKKQSTLNDRGNVRARGDEQPVRVVLDAHNALYRIPERMAEIASNPLKQWGLRREARALRRYEAAAYNRFDTVVFVTEVDREQLFQADGSKARGRPATSVIPICVDPESRPMVPRVQHPRDIVHVGTMFWPPNIEGVLWFGREVFPRIRQQVPDTHFVIIGKDPPQAVRDLSIEDPHIRVTGYVPKLSPHLAEAAVFVVPLRAGGGMRVKIVDAWCWGIPIVSTTIGAEGIAVDNGRNILIADEPESLAQEVVRVLDTPSLGEQLRADGRTWVEKRYNWRKVYSSWDTVYGQLV